MTLPSSASPAPAQPENAPDSAPDSAPDPADTTTEDDVRRIIASAERLGIELDEADTLQWLSALASGALDSDITVDESSRTFGHRVSMLDFSDRDLERFRRIGAIVEVTGPEGVAESALALSGSAAQSKIQSYPGDCDYFQRLNIIAPTREEACRITAQLLRDKALAEAHGVGYQFLEGKFGSYPAAGFHNGVARKAGTPITWRPAEIEAGAFEFELADGGSTTIRWEEVANDPGWCKLDWIVCDVERGALSNASNVIDVTWEGPDGQIVALDGYLDAYFQEVYLDAEDVPIFAKVAAFVDDDALDVYVDRLEEEVRKYLTKQLNYGKAAKRMYNIFRLSGRHVDAAFVRELFDEPATVLYQTWSLIGALENATQPGSSIPLESIEDQTDSLIMQVVDTLEGEDEHEIVVALLKLRRVLSKHDDGEARLAEVEAAQQRVVNLVNTFFREKLMELPSIRTYIEGIQAGHAIA